MKKSEIPNGIIFIWKYNSDDSGSVWGNLLGKAITFFTGKPYTHAEIWCEGNRYGSRADGPVKTPRKPGRSGVVWLAPKERLTEKQTESMKEYLDSKLGDKANYNVFKLVVLALVYPTRWFWQWIGWVPFQRDFFGVICSVYVDEAYKAAGIDLLPGKSEEYTAPGDFLSSDKVEKV
jgi:hypothetical protein